MKVFVYTKDQRSEKITTIDNVMRVSEIEAGKSKYLVITTRDGRSVNFDTMEVKTTIYQN